MSLSSVLNDRGSKERAFVLGCSPRLAATVGKTADGAPASLRFAQLVRAPLLTVSQRAVDARTIGTAFDYRARLELSDFDPAHSVGYAGLEYLRAILRGETAIGSRIAPEYERAWPSRDAFAAHKYQVLSEGFDEAVRLLAGSAEDRDRAAILLAWCEQVFLAGTRAMDRSLGDLLVGARDGRDLAACVDFTWILQLNSILAVARPQIEAWRTEIAEHGGPGSVDTFWSEMTPTGPGSERPFYFPNPGFLGSGLVGGADGDWIVGETLIDCKTDQRITVGSLREHLLQLIGYALLDLDDWYRIRRVAIWYPRFGLLPTWSLDTLLSGDSEELLPRLRGEVRGSWGARQAVAVRGVVDRRRLGVLLAQNVNTPFEMLAELVESTGDVLTLKHVANNRGTPIEVLRRLATHIESRAREQVARNPATPPDLVTRLLEDHRIDVRRGSLMNPVMPVTTLLAFADDPKYRAAVASNPVLPVDTLLAMAKDSRPGDVQVRRAIAKNPASTPDVLKALNYWDGDATVVLRRAEMTPDLIAEIYADAGDNAVHYLQDKLRAMWSWQAIGQRPRLHAVDELRELDAQARVRLAGFLASGFSLQELRQTFALPDGGASAPPSADRVESELTLGLIAASPIAELRALAAVHQDAQPDQLRLLALDRDPLVRAAVALNPMTPREALDDLAVESRIAVDEGTWPDVLTFLSLNPMSSVRADAAAIVERIEAEAEAARGAAATAILAKRRGSEAPVKRAERHADEAERAVMDFDPSRETPQQQVLRRTAEHAKATLAEIQATLLATLAREASRTEIRTVRSELSEAKQAERAARAAWNKTTSVRELRKEARRLRERARTVRAAYERTDAYLAPFKQTAAHAVYRARAGELEKAESVLQHDRLTHQAELLLLEIARNPATAPGVLTAIVQAGIRPHRISLRAAMNTAIDFDGTAQLIDSNYGGWDGCGCFIGGFGATSSTCDESLSLAIATSSHSSDDLLRRLARRCSHEAVREAATQALSHRREDEPPAPIRTDLVPRSETEIAAQAMSEHFGHRAAVADNPDLRPDIMIRMASDTRAEVRASLARNPNAPTEILDFLAGEKSITVRRVVASHPGARPELLEQLAQENDYEIHWRLALNNATPPALLARLAADPSPEIAVSAMLNRSTPPHALEHVAQRNDQLLNQLAGMLTSSTRAITERRKRS